MFFDVPVSVMCLTAIESLITSFFRSRDLSTMERGERTNELTVRFMTIGHVISLLEQTKLQRDRERHSFFPFSNLFIRLSLPSPHVIKRRAIECPFPKFWFSSTTP